MKRIGNKKIHMEPIASRLRVGRGDRSARELAAILAPVLGREPAHSSVLDYEKRTDPPATYVAAFCEALSINPTWLLLGQGPRLARREPLRSLAFQIQEEVMALAHDNSRSEEEVRELFELGLRWLRGEDPGGD